MNLTYLLDAKAIMIRVLTQISGSLTLSLVVLVFMKTSHAEEFAADLCIEHACACVDVCAAR